MDKIKDRIRDPVQVDPYPSIRWRYTIASLVTNKKQYGQMVASFKDKGFSAEDCQFLYVDNSNGNTRGAFALVNRLLRAGNDSEYLILAHQDLLLLTDGRRELDNKLSELSEIDPNWAICGNAGRTPCGAKVIRISDKYGADQKSHINFPVEVLGLDENFLVIKSDACLSVSQKIDEFHFYGTELCLTASFLGRAAYVIDFHLKHLGDGKKGESFKTAQKKWAGLRSRFLALRIAGSTAHVTVIGGNSLLRTAVSRLVTNRFLRRTGAVSMLYKLVNHR